MPMTFKNYLTKTTKKRNKSPMNGLRNVFGGYNYPQDINQSGDGDASGGEDEEEMTSPKDIPNERISKKTNKATIQDDTDPDEADDTESGDDPNRQGLLRTVKGAHLVYKRETDEGTFEELWIYGTEKESRNGFDIRKDILAGTDIPIDSMSSEDGEQVYTMWTAGNAQMIKIEGLPN